MKNRKGYRQMVLLSCAALVNLALCSAVAVTAERENAVHAQAGGAWAGNGYAQVQTANRDRPPAAVKIDGAQWLQKEMNDARPGVPTTIVLNRPGMTGKGVILLDRTVVVPSAREITLRDDGHQRSIQGAPGVQTLFYVEPGAELTLAASKDRDEMLTIENAGGSRPANGSIATVDGGRLIIRSGRLLGGQISAGGVVVVKKGGRLAMRGGAVLNARLSGTVPTAPVILKGCSSLVMNGGRIQGNIRSVPAEAVKSGDTGERAADREVMGSGGILVCAGDEEGAAHLEITGRARIIDNGNLAGSGGGITVAGKARIRLTGGLIAGNRASGSGGGIYVGAAADRVYLNNILITQNTAACMGGGLWLSAGGSFQVSQERAMAICDNMARSRGGSRAAGDDLVSLAGMRGKLTLGRYMLGGGEVFWYVDGAVTGRAERFDPAAPGRALTAGEVRKAAAGGKACAWKMSATMEARTAARKAARLVIRGNQAVCGGGIGIDGRVTVAGG